MIQQMYYFVVNNLMLTTYMWSALYFTHLFVCVCVYIYTYLFFPP